jgi:hypothetical protein
VRITAPADAAIRPVHPCPRFGLATLLREQHRRPSGWSRFALAPALAALRLTDRAAAPALRRVVHGQRFLSFQFIQSPVPEDDNASCHPASGDAARVRSSLARPGDRSSASFLPHLRRADPARNFPVAPSTQLMAWVEFPIQRAWTQGRRARRSVRSCHCCRALRIH